MNLNEQLKSEFDVLTPLSGDDTIVHNVLERTNAMNKNTVSSKRKARRIIIPAAAAAIMIAATVSVGAVTDWNFNSALNGALNALRNKYASGLESTTQSNSVTDLSEYGKELDLWYAYDGFKLNIKGVCADTRVAYLFVDVVFDEGFDFSGDLSDLELTCTRDTADELVCEMGSAIISAEGRTIQYCLYSKLYDGESWEGKTMTADFLGLYRAICTNVDEEGSDAYKTLEMNTHVDIPIDFPLVPETTYELNEEIELGAYSKRNKQYLGGEDTGILKSVTISPLSIHCEILADTSRMGKGDSYAIDLTVNTANGEIECYGGGSTTYDDNRETHYSDFTVPINPDDIISITVCGEEIPLT